MWLWLCVFVGGCLFCLLLFAVAALYYCFMQILMIHRDMVLNGQIGQQLKSPLQRPTWQDQDSTSLKPFSCNLCSCWPRAVCAE